MYFKWNFNLNDKITLYPFNTFFGNILTIGLSSELFCVLKTIKVRATHILL